MRNLTKIATCCFCGTRSVLTLRGKVRHELSCASCGAPIHMMKALPQEAAPEPARKARRGAAKPVRETAPRRKDKRRKRRSPARLVRKLFDEFWDEVEDLID